MIPSLKHRLEFHSYRLEFPFIGIFPVSSNQGNERLSVMLKIVAKSKLRICQKIFYAFSNLAFSVLTFRDDV